MSYDEVVFKRSYLNLILLNRAIPGFKPFDDEDDEESGVNIKRSKKKKKNKAKERNVHANDFFMDFM